jgi:hypothetical protein
MVEHRMAQSLDRSDGAGTRIGIFSLPCLDW